jgi:hypothetical protein
MMIYALQSRPDCNMRPVSKCISARILKELGSGALQKFAVDLGDDRDRYRTDLGHRQWTGDVANGETSLIEGRGYWVRITSDQCGKEVTLFIVTYDLALKSKDGSQQRSRVES